MTERQISGKADPVFVTPTQNGAILDFSGDWYSEFRGDIDQLFVLLDKYKGQTESGYTGDGSGSFTQRVHLDDRQIERFMAEAQSLGLPISLAQARSPLPPIVRGTEEEGGMSALEKGVLGATAGGTAAYAFPEQTSKVAGMAKKAGKAALSVLTKRI